VAEPAFSALLLDCKKPTHVEALKNSTQFRLRQLPLAMRRALALLLATAAIGYCSLLVATYLQLASPSSLGPDIREVDRLLFGTEKPVSQIERLLEAESGPMSSGGTMRPAFTDQSTGWEELTKSLSTGQLAILTAEREGERLALLDWIRSGASRDAYEQDEHSLTNPAGVTQLTRQYRLPDGNGAGPTAPPRVRIRTLLTDRCVTCHGENGRHDTARFVELDSYDRLEPRLRPETSNRARRAWLIAALVGIFPLAAIAGPTFYFTSQPQGARRLLLATTIAALGVMLACWFLGRENSYFLVALLCAAGVAIVGILMQMIASLAELLTIERASSRE
jgi:hypothetical protein